MLTIRRSLFVSHVYANLKSKPSSSTCRYFSSTLASKAYPNYSFSENNLLHTLQREYRPLSIYIHWPYCKKICPYCDFNRYVRDKIPHEAITEIYLHLLSKHLKQILLQNTNRHIHSLFFGGGTPSLANASFFERIINFCKQFSGDISEITIEANPTSIEMKKLNDFKLAGINRISIGVQSLDDDELKFLGRDHTSLEALKAIEIAKSVFGERNVSADFIFGTPKHIRTPDHWYKLLNSKIIPLQLSHLSLYQLSIESNTPFYKNKEIRELLFSQKSEEILLQLYEIGKDIVEKDSNMEQYEISNFAIPGHECKHNLQYWTYRDFLGIGPGAHSRMTSLSESNTPEMKKMNIGTNFGSSSKISSVQIMSPENWMYDVKENNSDGNVKKQTLSIEERLQELFLNRLRLLCKNESLKSDVAITEDLIYYHSNGKFKSFEKLFSPETIQQLKKNDFLKFSTPNHFGNKCNIMSITERGSKVLNSVLKFLFQNVKC